MNHQRDSEDMAEVLSSVINKGHTKKARSPHRHYRLTPFGKKLIAGGLIAALCLIVILLFVFVFRKSDSALKKQLIGYQETSGFTLYEPKGLPEGYKADTADTSTSSGVIFTILKSTGADKPTITISQQSIPANITADTLYGLAAPDATDTKNGKLYIGTSNDTMNATLVTDSSWILFSAPKSINAEVIKTLASSMEPIR